MMKNNINTLLEKYWNAEANLQEEAELRSYFSSDDVADDHLPYKDLFAFFSEKRLESTDLEVEHVLANLSNIDLILEKYWDGETSLEEESQLREYFAGASIAPEHIQYKDLFTFYTVSRKMSTNIEFNVESHRSDDIDHLMEKYWNAETSLEEEQKLKSYFAGNEVAEQHLAYSDMFETYSSLANHTTDLDVRSMLTKAENELGNRAIGSTSMPSAAKTKVFSLQKWAVGIAAIFVMGFAAITLMDQDTQTMYKGQSTILDQEADAQEAYEITKEALAFLSKNMNTGSKTVVESVSKAEKVSIFK